MLHNSRDCIIFAQKMTYTMNYSEIKLLALTLSREEQLQLAVYLTQSKKDG